jgi:hypothetical protein
MKTSIGFTKEVVNNYLPKFCALIGGRVMFHCEPVGALLRFQVVVQPLIKERTLVFDISIQGLNKAFGGTGARPSEPKGMFETDENSWTCYDKKKIIAQRRTLEIRPIKAFKDGTCRNWNR